jgi:spermidine synthase
VRDAWRSLLARLRVLRAPVDPLGVPLRPARIRLHGEYASLQFRRGQTQSRMRVEDPDALLIDYTRTMLGCLLWRPRPRLLGMVGLGGGSQVKFLRRHFAATRVEVVENHPGVLALRARFGVPPDDAMLEVSLDDGARFLRARRGRYDLLLLDGYDEHGIPPALSTQDYYDDCRDALADGGALAANLFCDDPEAHVARLRNSFGVDHVLVLSEPRMSNRVAFAWRGDGGANAAAAIASLPGAVRDELAPVLDRIAAALAWQRTAGAAAR